MLSITFQRLIAECFGTFALVFAGTSAIVINDLTGGTVTHVGVALTFGLVVLALIYSLGEVSGAHFNPAVTIGFWAAQRFPSTQVMPYLLSQLAGALIASTLVHLLFPTHVALGATHPAGPPVQSFVLEIVLALFLMLVILSVSIGAKEKGITAGVAVGSVIALEALFAGPISGASMNPARSLAPAFVAGNLRNLWIYIVAPVVGALSAVPLCRCIHARGCCSAVPCSEPSR